MKLRLDKLLLEKELVPSREKAQALILAGKVRVDDQIVDKVGRLVNQQAKLKVIGKDHPYVSRGGVKMKGALNHFKVNPAGWVAMDIGSSTGGFTHCLILEGAEKVFAVDVGYGQLAWELQQDSRVISMERTNIRHLEFERVSEYMDLVVIDASFISLRLIFPKSLEFLKSGGLLLALVKPQFEAGIDEVGKRGKVTDVAVHERVLESLKKDAEAIGFKVLGQSVSSIVGKKSGNQEFFLLLQK